MPKILFLDQIQRSLLQVPQRGPKEGGDYVATCP